MLYLKLGYQEPNTKFLLLSKSLFEKEGLDLASLASQIVLIAAPTLWIGATIWKILKIDSYKKGKATDIEKGGKAMIGDNPNSISFLETYKCLDICAKYFLFLVPFVNNLLGLSFLQLNKCHKQYAT